MTQERLPLPHGLTLKDRKSLTMTGVTEVISFDDATVILHTQLGTLQIHGQQLQLKNLSLEGGQVAVDGKIDALIYEEPRPEGWLRRLFG
jgi:sporulation protein YabP